MLIILLVVFFKVILNYFSGLVFSIFLCIWFGESQSSLSEKIQSGGISLASLISTSSFQEAFLTRKPSGTEVPLFPRRATLLVQRFLCLILSKCSYWELFFFYCACEHLVINQINISPQTLLLYKSLCSVYTLLSVLGIGDYIYNYWLPTCLLLVPWGQQLPKNMDNRPFLFIYISQFLTQLLVHGRSSIIMEEMSEYNYINPWVLWAKKGAMY